MTEAAAAAASSPSTPESAPETGAQSPSEGGSTGERGALSASPQRPLTPHERRERLLAKLRERSGAGDVGSSSPGGGSDAAPDSAHEPAREPGAAGDSDAADEQKPRPESREEREQKDLELRLSRVSRELREARAEALEAKEAVTQYRQLTDKIKRAKSDAYSAIQLMPELYGFDFGQLADFVVQNEGRFREQQKYSQLPPDVREEIELARRERQERHEKAQKEQAYQQEVERFTTYQKSAETFLESNKEDYPLSHAIGWAPGQIARTAIERGTRDARPLLDELEKNLRDQLVGAFGNAQVLRALVGHDRTLADKVRQALDSNGSSSNVKPNKSPAAASFRSGTEQPITREGPASISNGVASSDTADYQTRRDLRRQRVMEEAKRFFHGR